eukprot:14920888-Ditylum_brightwellii.AAC.1
MENHAHIPTKNYNLSHICSVRKGYNEEDRHQAILELLHPGTLLAYKHEERKQVHNSDKVAKMPCKRKCFKMDAARQL